MKKDYFKKLVKRNNSTISIFAEMSGNHQSSYKNGLKFIRSCIRQKVDAVKFQVYTPETITIKSLKKDFLLKKNNEWGNFKTLYDLYKQAHTPWNWVKKYSQLLNKKKIPWFASAFDETAIDFLEQINCQAYKIASPEITDINLIEKISKLNKPIFLSTGLASVNDLDLAVKIIKKQHLQFSILKCSSSYPAPEEDLNLKSLEFIKKRYRCSVGFSDHTLKFDAAKVAVAFGATIFEKHFKEDKDNFSIDRKFSTKISKYNEYKDGILNSKKSLGSAKLFISKSSKQNFNGRRSLYVVQKIKKGEKFTLSNIKSIRPAFGLHPKYLKKIIGKFSTKNLYPGDRLKKTFVKYF